MMYILLLIVTLSRQTFAGMLYYYCDRYALNNYICIAFTISPSSQVIGIGQMAVFRCQNLDADFISWRVNETQVTFNIPHPDPNIITDTTMDDNNNVINRLSITAQSKFNETEIICIAGSIGGNLSDTTPVKLLVQGKQGSDCISNCKTW